MKKYIVLLLIMTSLLGFSSCTKNKNDYVKSELLINTANGHQSFEIGEHVSENESYKYITLTTWEEKDGTIIVKQTYTKYGEGLPKKGKLLYENIYKFKYTYYHLENTKVYG